MTEFGDGYRSAMKDMLHRVDAVYDQMAYGETPCSTCPGNGVPCGWHAEAVMIWRRQVRPRVEISILDEEPAK